MRFLITGAYGFVGTNLCKYLTSKGHICDALDLPSAKRDDVPYANFYPWNAIPPSTTNDELRITNYSCIVHLAGKAHDLKNVSSEQSYFDINVGLTQRIFEALKSEIEKVGTQKKIAFIYFSSSKASPTGNAYGRSKFQAEQYLTTTLSTKNYELGITNEGNSSPTLFILRPAMIHGPGNKGNLNLLWGVAKRGIPWPLAAFENRRSFTSIGNICAVVEALAATSTPTSSSLHLDLSPTPFHTFPVSDDSMLSTNRLIELMAEAAGRTPRLWRLPKRMMIFIAKLGDILHLPLNTERLAKLTEDSFVDNSALKEFLGWTQMPISAETGIRITLASFANAASFLISNS